MRKLFLRTTCVLLSFAAAVFSMSPLERAGKDASRWMEQLPDETPLGSLSVPGTHDSAALHSLADAAGKCQSLTVKEQLTAGVRFFDLRLRQDGDSLHLVHSFVDQRTTLEEVLDCFDTFLSENPSEFLLVSFKEDTGAIRPEGTFAHCLENCLEGSSAFSAERTLPDSLGDARGKMIVLARYDSASVGVDVHAGWQDDASFSVENIWVQDDYRVENPAEKLESIDHALDIAKAQEFDLVLNFTSCYLTSGFPPTYAAAPARAILPALSDTAASGEGSMGVMVCDFMTAELAEKIIGRNFK